MTALRAGPDRSYRADLSTMVPVSRFEMLVCADWLRRELGVFGRCSRKLVRHLCRAYWRAGWCNRDIVHAMDHRPSAFSEVSGLLLSPEHVHSPAQFVRSRLTAWRGESSEVLPGYWSTRQRDATIGRSARVQIRARHGRAGARLLRAGERALTPAHITEYGRAAVTPTQSGEWNRAEHQTERNRRRAELVAQARRALTQPDLSAPSTESPRLETEATTTYDRALARARSTVYGSSSVRRRHHRR